jgi:hypothetical protein
MEVLLAMGLPTLVFGVFALLAMWLGQETRPWFNERPVLDDRPNWFPIVRRLPDDDDDEAGDDLGGGVPGPLEVPDAEPGPAAQPRPAAATRAATNPSGV